MAELVGLSQPCRARGGAWGDPEPCWRCGEGDPSTISILISIPIPTSIRILIPVLILITLLILIFLIFLIILSTILTLLILSTPCRHHCISPGRAIPCAKPRRGCPQTPSKPPLTRTTHPKNSPSPPPHLLGAELPLQVPGSVVPDEVVQRVPALRPLPARARREHPRSIAGSGGRGAGRSGARGAERSGAERGGHLPAGAAPPHPQSPPHNTYTHPYGPPSPHRPASWDL